MDRIPEPSSLPAGGPILFREIQAVRQSWVWALVLAIPTGMAAMFGYGIYRQIGAGEPWGDRPLSDTGLVWVALAMVLLASSPLLLLLVLRLVTEVREDRLVLRFRPFLTREIPLRDIRACRARTYRPIREFGGWGIRGSPARRSGAWNMSGDRGVQLEFTDGRSFLIGSARADELARVLSERLG